MPIAYLLDLEGTLYTDQGVIPGAPEAIAALRGRGTRFRCVSNTTTRTRAALAARLAGYGYDIPASDILTPVSAAVAHCRTHGLNRVVAYVREAALEDLTGLEVLPRGEAGYHGQVVTPDAILVGDLGDAWTFAVMQEAFTHVVAGAEILALSRDRYFSRESRLTLDAGAFVAGLEYATGRTAMVLGKPSATFFQMARATFHDSDEVIMVGDDLWSDIQGAQRAGLRAWLVRTGKFQEHVLRDSGVTPDRIIDSVVEVGSEK